MPASRRERRDRRVGGKTTLLTINSGQSGAFWRHGRKPASASWTPAILRLRKNHHSAKNTAVTTAAAAQAWALRDASASTLSAPPATPTSATRLARPVRGRRCRHAWTDASEATPTQTRFVLRPQAHLPVCVVVNRLTAPTRVSTRSSRTDRPAALLGEDLMNEGIDIDVRLPHGRPRRGRLR